MTKLSLFKNHQPEKVWRQLNDQLQNEVDTKKRAELHAVIKVAELLLTSGPMVPTQEAGKIYTKEKNLFLGLAEENLKKQKSSHIFNVLSRHMEKAISSKATGIPTQKLKTLLTF